MDDYSVVCFGDYLRLAVDEFEGILYQAEVDIKVHTYSYGAKGYTRMAP